MASDEIGFVGLGNMGRPMATNVVSSGRAVVVRDAAGTQARAPQGAAHAASNAALAGRVDDPPLRAGRPGVGVDRARDRRRARSQDPVRGGPPDHRIRGGRPRARAARRARRRVRGCARLGGRERRRQRDPGDHANTPTATQIGRLFHLSFAGIRSRRRKTRTGSRSRRSPAPARRRRSSSPGPRAWKRAPRSPCNCWPTSRSTSISSPSGPTRWTSTSAMPAKSSPNGLRRIRNASIAGSGCSAP